MNNIKIYVINLLKRKDRKIHIENMFLEKCIDNYEFVSAIETAQGYYGCVLSHIKALQKAKLEDLPEVLIMEDDFHFTGNGVFIYPPKCDVCLYGCNVINREKITGLEYENFYKVNKAQQTDFYLVKKHYYDKLINIFIQSLMNLLMNYEKENYLDIYWIKAQQEDLFICPKIRLGHQIKGFSDIKNKIVNRDLPLS